MYHLKMGKPMSNAKSVRMLMLPELSDDKKRASLLAQGHANSQVNNCSTRDKSTPGNKYLRPQLLLSSDAMMTHLLPTDYTHETSSWILSAMVSKFTTPRKPTWEPLLPL
jgi:hypothetical protein